MHIKINKASFAEALNSVQTVVGSKASLSVLQNVMIAVKGGKAEFVCSDLEVTLQTSAECETIEDGRTTLPVKLLASAIGKVVDGVVEIQVDAKDKAKVTAGTSVFRVNGIAATEFPALPEVEGQKITIPSAALREMFRKASIAMCQDETRVNLRGVCLDFSQGEGKVAAVATDGRRLSLLNSTIEVPDGFSKQFIVPRKAVETLLKRLTKDGDCEIYAIGSQLSFVTSKFRFITRLIDNAYPNYQQVIPKTPGETITVNRAELIGAIDRVSVIADSDAASVELDIGDNRILLNSKNAELGSSKDEIPVKYVGQKFVMHFDPQYIRDVLNILDEDEVDMVITAEGAPMVIRKAGSDDYTYVVMPLRV